MDRMLNSHTWGEENSEPEITTDDDDVFNDAVYGDNESIYGTLDDDPTDVNWEKEIED